MRTNRSIRANKKLLAALPVALVAAMACYFVFAQGGAAAQAVGGRAEAQRSEPTIVGGEAVPDGEYPFVTAILNTNSGNAPGEQFCGGSLIDRNSVLTAAHCFNHIGVSPQPIRVAVGRTVLDSDQGQVRHVSSISIDPSYDPPKTDQEYDVAVLRLSSPVEGVPHMRLADAHQDYLEEPGRHATVAGWGNTVAHEPGEHVTPSHPDHLREAHVPLVSDAVAKLAYGEGYHAALMLAAGRKGLDSCQGDSGGPLFAHTAEGPTQIGIVSFGSGCGAAGFPGVYAEVNNPSIRHFIVSKAD